jgi:2'-5' RNA ligase
MRLAVAVRPSPAAVDRLAGFPRPPRPGTNWSVPEQWIVRLRPLGHVAEALWPGLADAVRAALDGAGPVDVRLGPVTERLGGQWLGVPARGLDDLGAAVFEATAGIVPVTHPQSFRADLVLARGKVPADLAGLPLDVRWTVEQVVLVADRSSPRAPRLVDVAVVPLRG